MVCLDEAWGIAPDFDILSTSRCDIVIDAVARYKKLIARFATAEVRHKRHVFEIKSEQKHNCI